MNSQHLYEHVRRTASALSFASGWVDPNIVRLFQQMAIDIDAKLANQGIKVGYDAPVQDLIFNIKIPPSEMRRRLDEDAPPLVLVSIQSIAEEAIGGAGGMLKRIEDAVSQGKIDRALASELHHWRMIRNIVAHGAGAVSQRHVDEATKLNAGGKSLFSSFTLQRPKHVHAVHIAGTPDTPESPVSVPFAPGAKLQIGLGDLLAAAKSWTDFMKAYGL